MNKKLFFVFILFSINLITVINAQSETREIKIHNTTFIFKKLSNSYISKFEKNSERFFSTCKNLKISKNNIPETVEISIDSNGFPFIRATIQKSKNHDNIIKTFYLTKNEKITFLNFSMEHEIGRLMTSLSDYVIKVSHDLIDGKIEKFDKKILDFILIVKIEEQDSWFQFYSNIYQKYKNRPQFTHSIAPFVKIQKDNVGIFTIETNNYDALYNSSLFAINREKTLTGDPSGSELIYEFFNIK